MRLIIQQRAPPAAGALRQVLPVVRKRDKSLFDQIHRAMNSVVLNIAEADGNDAGMARARFASACGSAKEVRAGLQLAVAYGYLPSAKVTEVDIARRSMRDVLEALRPLEPTPQAPSDGAHLVELLVEVGGHVTLDVAPVTRDVQRRPDFLCGPASG